MPATSTTVTRSIWLPIGRANFFSYSANGWMIRDELGDRTASVWSHQLDRDDYTPLLQVSVLRRLLEVLPRSFGYEPQGRCTLSGDDGDDLTRPTSVAMTLRPATAVLPAGECPQRTANDSLIEANVTLVELRADEDGFYTFTATSENSAAREALDDHVREIFGGDFSLAWQAGDLDADESTSVNGAPARVYNGRPAHGDDTVRHYPRGILTFFQLNTMFEGIFNDALTPAIFFEQHDFMKQFLEHQDTHAGRDGHRATRVLRTVSDVVDILATNGDASGGAGRVLTLRHFLAVTSRESLQRLKWSLESVRRSLLDEMMGILHRQSRLVQLRLDQAGKAEQTPEIAVGANESQLRGYVMLAGAKLPLVTNVHRFATSAADRIAADDADVADLRYRVNEWSLLLAALKESVRGLERAVEHAWMERMLYEQEQSRAEQESMAEIERSRRTRTSGGAGGSTGVTYNALMLYFTVAAVLIGAATIPKIDWTGHAWSDITGLWPFAAVAIVLSLIPITDRIRSFRRELRNANLSYGYEFSFRLDVVVDPIKVSNYVNGGKAVQPKGTKLKRLAIEPRGGVRIEYISRDATMMKVHSVATFRARRRRQLFPRTIRFEIINEFLARKVPDHSQYVLRECRMFGDVPRPLTYDEVMQLVTVSLDSSGLSFQPDSGTPLTAKKVLQRANDLFKPPGSAGVHGAPAA